MSVAGLDSSEDWQFGRGLASYLRNSDEIRQNVLTRLRSFTDDWFADMSAGIPWLDLLGARESEKRMLRDIETAILRTDGVRSIERLRVTDIDGERAATIEISVIDIFDERFDESVSIT